LESRRIQMLNVSAAMGGQFAWSAAEFTEEIRRMGPNPLSQTLSPVVESTAAETDHDAGE
jgi:hypothetical protein